MYLEWGVRDAPTGDVWPFATEQEARDWMNPNVGNPNPGSWELVCRKVEDWALPMGIPGAPTLTAPSLWEGIDACARWVLSQPQIMQHLPHKKIQAIKECRALSSWGLKEAKEAVEGAMALQEKGYLSDEEAAQLERDAQEAIKSILEVET